MTNPYMLKADKEHILGKKILLFSIMLIISGFLNYMKAQDSLNFYLKLAAQNNPELQANYNLYLAALQKAPQVSTLTDPEITLGYFPKPKEELMGKQIADIQLMQMFPWFGTLSASRAEALAMAQARYYEYTDIRNRVFYETRINYYQLFKQKQSIELTRKKLKYLHSLENLTTIQFQSNGGGIDNKVKTASPNSASEEAAGMQVMNSTPVKSNGSKTSSMNNSGIEMEKAKGLTAILQIKLEIAEEENNLENLQNQLHGEIVRFNTRLNRAIDSEVIMADSLSIPSITFDSIPKTYPENAMVQMLKAEQKSYESMVLRSRKMGYPMMGIGLDYMILNKSMQVTSMDNGKDMVVPMFKMTVPIFRKKYRAMQQENQYRITAVSQKEIATVNDLVADLENIRIDLKNAEKRIRLYNQQITLTKQIIAIQTQGFSNSENSLEEILGYQQKMLELEFKRTEAITDLLTGLAKADYLTSKTIITEETPVQ